MWFFFLGCAVDGDAEAGATVYASACESCHGADGAAQIDWGGVPATDLHEAVQELDPEQVGDVVRDGSGAMPAVDGLSSQDIADVVAYCFATFTAKP